MTENTELATRDAELMNTLNDSTKLGIIRNLFAKGLNETEFAVFLELAKRYRLDPFSRQIWAIKYGSEDAKIFVGRDGYLAVAHKSPYFDGMESGTLTDDKGELIGWCRVHRSDMQVPFYVEVYASEYTTKKSLWLSKPRTMIQKVAECQCLRRAFNLSGFYDPDEIGEDADVEQSVSPSHSSAHTCPRCGKPSMTGDELDKFQRYFRELRDVPLPAFLCRECADKLWRETDPARTQQSSTDADADTGTTQEPAPQSEDSGDVPRCDCGREALTGDRLTRYVERFRDVHRYTLKTPICEVCANALWKQMIQNGTPTE